MLRIVSKSSDKHCGTYKAEVTPQKFREVSNKNSKVRECKCGLTVGIPFNGEMEVRYYAA